MYEARCCSNETAIRTNTLEVQKQNSHSERNSHLHAIKIRKQPVSSWVTILPPDPLGKQNLQLIPVYMQFQ